MLLLLLLLLLLVLLLVLLLFPFVAVVGGLLEVSRLLVHPPMIIMLKVIAQAKISFFIILIFNGDKQTLFYEVLNQEGVPFRVISGISF